MTVNWPVKAGKSYAIHYSPDLRAGSWAVIADGLTSGPFVDTDAIRLARSNGYYRVAVP